jgi:hypothetical protein
VDPVEDFLEQLEQLPKMDLLLVAVQVAQARLRLLNLW